MTFIIKQLENDPARTSFLGKNSIKFAFGRENCMQNVIRLLESARYIKIGPIPTNPCSRF